MDAWDLTWKPEEIKVGKKFNATFLGVSSWTKDLEVAKDFANGRRRFGFVLKATIKPEDTLVDVTRLPQALCEKLPQACKESEVITIPDDIYGEIIEVYAP